MTNDKLVRRYVNWLTYNCEWRIWKINDQVTEKSLVLNVESPDIVAIEFLCVNTLSTILPCH